jgi:predicted methyltransferase
MMRTALLAILSVPLFSQAAAEANANYRSAEARKKMVATLDGSHRDARQRPKELLAALRLKPGMSVADIGTGPGYMLPFLVEAVGPGGKVFAEDIFADFLDRAREKAREQSLSNVSFVLGTETSPNLPANAIDVAFILDAYHHFDYPEQMLGGIRQSLKAGGRLAIVDYYKRRGAMSNPNPDFAVSHIRLDDTAVIKEVEANGFRMVEHKEFLQGSQYIAIFEKR